MCNSARTQTKAQASWLPGLLLAGGYNIQMFVGLAGSHVYIYFFDHYRVLRSIQSCNYADKMVDWWTQWLMCIPCGFMLACVVFKVGGRWGRWGRSGRCLP